MVTKYNGQEAPTSLGRSNKEFVETRVAIGFVILLLKEAIVQLGQAKGTHEVLWVKPAPHGTDAAPHNGLPTSLAHCPLMVVKVELTEGPPI